MFSSKATSTRLSALDMINSNVMVADADLNIVYMNPSVTAFLKEAEAELRKELPTFDVAKLIGTNIDQFHKNPSHQRQMLSALTKPHNATIRVGTRMFDLIASPLHEKGKRLGTVVEWADAALRLQNLDYFPAQNWGLRAL